MIPAFPTNDAGPGFANLGPLQTPPSFPMPPSAAGQFPAPPTPLAERELPPLPPPPSAIAATAPPIQRKPVVRGEKADEPVPAALLGAEHPRSAPLSLTMPPPEQLGIGRTRAPEAPAEEFDWKRVDRRMKDLGATSYGCQRLAQGGFRFVVLLPTTQANRVHHVEAEAPTPAEAYQRALERSEELAGRQQ